MVRINNLRRFPNNLNHNRTHAGGIITLSNDTFRNNYVDIMFSEWSFGGICQPTCSTTNWQSSIDSCYFDTLADNYFCNNYVDTILSRYEAFYNGSFPVCHDAPTYFEPPTNPPVPIRCHIVDLSPYVEFWYRFNNWLCPDLMCKRSYWYPSKILDNNIFKGQRCVAPCTKCYDVQPHDEYE